MFLERIAKEGSNFFYLGDGSALIADFFSDGGLLTKKSLKDYHVAIRKPIQTTFRGVEFFSNPAPSVGGTLIIFLLKLLEESNLKNIHFSQLLNAMLITNIARSQVCLDPNQEYQINTLLEDDVFIKYLQKHIKETSNDQADFERGCTTHVSVIDKEMNSVSVTTTNGEGCGYLLPDTGIMMNNMLGEADLNPLGFHAYKHSMRLPTMVSPSIIIKDDLPLIVLGSGGSNRIRSAIVQVIINFLIKGMDIDDAIHAPRMHLEGNHILHEPGIEIDHGLFVDDFSIRPFENKNLFFGGVNAVTPYGGCSDPRRGGTCQII
jgi:gamma-glutamyltranspeptidase/glutathione hydrolase